MALRSRRPRAEEGRSRLDPDRMTLVEHLTELRTRIIKVAIAIAVGGAVGFFLYNRVLDVLIDPYCEILAAQDPERACRLVVTDPVEAFSIRLKLSAYVGLLLASPVVLWQLWRFITPGLYDKEKRYAIPFVLSSVVLFLLGGLLAIWTFPKTLDFFVAFGGENLETFYSPGKYLGLLTFMMLAFGLGFEFPVVLTFLQVAGMLSWRRLVSWRRYAIVLIFVVDSVITPSGDPVTLAAMAIPMCILYEASILIGRFVIKRG